MKKKFTILVLIFSVLSNASIAQDSTAPIDSNNKKNSRFEEKLQENKEKRQQRINEIKQKREDRRENRMEKREERREDRNEQRIENRGTKMLEISQGQQPPSPREPNKHNRR
jgi:hypothetical protein